MNTFIKEILMRKTTVTISMACISFAFYISCQKTSSLEDGNYNVVSIEFQDSVSFEDMKDDIAKIERFQIKDNEIILLQGERYNYCLRDDSILVSGDGMQKCYKYEKILSSAGTEYVLSNENDSKIKRLKIFKE